MKSSIFGGLAAFVLAATGVSAITPITIKGNAFFAGDERFYIRGVDFQPGGASNKADPLASGELCKEVIPYFKQLGINAIRVYAIDNSKDHSDCMSQLEEAGIYLILDVNTGTRAINRADPAPSYNAVLLQGIFATIDAFKGFDNTMAFFSANEVINDLKTTGSATYVKAVTRDMRRYMKAQSKRYIPIGYSAADVADNRMQTAEYLNCGSDDARSDFFAFNDYSWCGDSSYSKSGYDEKVKNFTDYGLPIFFSEYGCNLVTPRKFTEVGAIYGDEMSKVFSGGLVYEFTQEENKYGLVNFNNDTGKITPLSDFTALKEQFADVSLPSGDGGAVTTEAKASKCPAQNKLWQASDDLPDMPKNAEQYIKGGAGKGLGNDAPSNMWSDENAAGPVPAGTNAAPTGTGKSDAAFGRPSAFLNLATVGITSWVLFAGAMGGYLVL
jgi:hypothetical protein